MTESVLLQVQPKWNLGPQTQRSFACRQVERTWVWPTAALTGRVLDLCLAELGAKPRSDPIWTRR